jgi:tetratricopeptide (TPR) repeat protein
MATKERGYPTITAVHHAPCAPVHGLAVHGLAVHGLAVHGLAVHGLAVAPCVCAGGQEPLRARLADMGVLDWLRRERRATFTPDQLRRNLFDAIAAHDGRKLAELCEHYAAVVVESYREWQTLPPEFDKPDKRAWYGDGLVALAEHFRVQRGTPELWQWLEEAMVFNNWREEIDNAAIQLDACEYDGARARVDRALELVALMPNGGADNCLPKTYSHLAACQWGLGDLRAGIETIARAAAGALASGDNDGLVGCLLDRYDMLRFLGDRTSILAAADCLEQVVPALERLGRSREADRWRRQAAVVRAGEPLCRAIAAINGERFELWEVTVPSSGVDFGYARNRTSMPATRKALAAGGEAFDARKLGDALAHFQRAAAVDDYDPEPHLRAGYVHLQLREFDAAVAAYRATELRAPGWENCRVMGWVAEQLLAGVFDFQVAQRIIKLMDPEVTGALQGTIASAGNKIHELALFHLAEGDALSQLGRRDRAEQSFRRGLELADERDVRTQLLGALAAHVTGPSRERLLRQAVELDGNLLVAARAFVDLAALVVKH